MNLIKLDDPESELFAPFRSLKHNQSEDYIVVDGSQTLENLLLKGAQPRYIIGTKEYYESRELLPNCPLYISERLLLKNIVGFNVHQGVMALFNKRAFCKIEDLSNRILCLNGLTSAENVGTIVRSCTAFMFDSLIFDHKTISPYSRRAVRVSMGHFHDLRIHQSLELEHTLQKLKMLGYTLIGTRNCSSSRSLKNFIFPPKFVLVIGSEGRGMDEEIESFLDINLKIDIKSGVDSLNAAQAASILLYEANRC